MSLPKTLEQILEPGKYYIPYVTPPINMVVLEDRKGFKKVLQHGEFNNYVKDGIYPIPMINIVCYDKPFKENTDINEQITLTKLNFTYKGTQQIGYNIVALYKEETW